MALRAYLGGITTQHGLLGCIASSSKLLSCSSARVQHPSSFHRATRGYAAASASLTKKTPVTAKGTRKDAHTQPQSPPRKVASRTPRKTTSSEMETAIHSANDTVAAEHNRTVQDSKAFNNMTEEEQTQELDRMLVMAQFMPTLDPWGQEVMDTLDVMIPHNINYKSYSRQTYEQIKDNTTNSFKNAAALSTLASANSIPGVTTLYRKSFVQKIREVGQIFGTQSVKSDSLVAPFRDMALAFYVLMNDSLASRSEKDLRKITTFSYQKHVLEMLRTSKSKHPDARLFWELHREYEPTRILSLRVTQGHLGDEEPRFGNRLMIHALLKFDTEQSLEIYNQQGAALHIPAPAAEKSSDQRIPAQRKRVTEYLVMEKRMWLQGPWTFREQLWPYASAS
ncbi:hypothetical protein BYT27DRAFT_7116937 [Phlegmacium glaucopus]|nr:hypothetical protein BYT27DRAFT_7116937 [Phlegmacium glaucopus]